MIVTERTHHGKYRNTRRLSTNSVNAAFFEKAGASCPYIYNIQEAQAEQLAQDFHNEGKAEFGWTTWTQEES